MNQCLMIFNDIKTVVTEVPLTSLYIIFKFILVHFATIFNLFLQIPSPF
jgi:hypothetical protein